ncbi:MAG: GNAT family N-acetyltransferase [Hyphomicrobiaceae bacterium]
MSAGPAEASPGRLTVELVSTRTGMDLLEQEWNDLFERAGEPHQIFQSFNWNWHWANHYLEAGGRACERRRLAIVAGRIEGRLAMIWPLIEVRRFGCRVLKWMGDPVSQYGDVLVEAGAMRMRLLEAGWSLLKRSGFDLAALGKVRADAAVAGLLGARGALRRDIQVAPYLDLSSATGFEAYVARYPAKDRKNRRRHMKRLAERGEIAFERLSTGERAAARAVEAIGLKRDWLLSKGLVSRAYVGRRMEAFFHDIAASTCHPVPVRVSALTVGGEAAAIEIGVASKGCFAAHVTVYHPDYERNSPGSLLLEDSIRHSFCEGIARYDLLAPGDTYKLNWSDGVVETADFALALSPAGRLYRALVVSSLKGRAKRSLAALPRSLRRAFAASFLTRQDGPEVGGAVQ